MGRQKIPTLLIQKFQGTFQGAQKMFYFIQLQDYQQNELKTVKYNN